jgi:mono/diheme cytochrome c family protein
MKVDVPYPDFAIENLIGLACQRARVGVITWQHTAFQMELAMRMMRAVVLMMPWAALAALPLVFSACGGGSSSADVTSTHVVGKSKEEIGKYITQIAGCHDCHTPGIMQGKELKDVGEAQWFTGSPLGFNGPWGTSYAPNLRLKVGPYNNDAMFIAAMRKRNDRPPMPWAALHAMTDEDLGAVFAYLKALGPSGVAMPEPLPVGKQPPQPFIVMVPDMGGGPAGSGPAPTTQPK